MSYLHRLRLPLAAVGLISAAALAGSAGAAPPAPCGGKPLATDKAGDQVLNPLNVTSTGGKKGPENSDATAFWLATEGAVTTANIQIANMSKTAPPPSDSQGGLYYYTGFSVDGAIRYVYAHLTTTGVTYGFGTFDPANGTYLDDGDTKGSFTEGANGVVTVEIPADIAKAGAKLTSISVMIDGITGGPDHVSGLNNNIDAVPDASGSIGDPTKFAYTVGPCAAAPAATPTPTPTPSGGSTGGGSTGGGSTGGGTTGGGTTTQPAPTSLPVTFDGVIGKAKKAKKKKSLKFGAKSSRDITAMTLTLKKLGGKGGALATGKVAKLTAGRAVKVSIKLKKTLKKGTYTLQAAGTSDGRRLVVGQKVQIR